MPIKRSEIKGTVKENSGKVKNTVKSEKIEGKENSPSQTNILKVPRSQIWNAIKRSKVAEWSTRGYLIWTGITFFVGFFAGASGISDDSFESMITIFDWIIYFVGFILVLIWCAKSYKILLKSQIKGLYLEGTAAVYWGAILPIANLFMPMKYVRDLYKHFNSILGKSFNNKLIGRRWGLWLTRLVGTRIITAVGTEDSSYRFSWFLAVGGLVASSILFVKIVRRVTRAQKVYLKRTKNLQE